MVRPPIHFQHALKILNVTVAGGATVLLSTISSCYLAVVVEKTAHRIQYYYFPHWYKDVDFALGLDLHRIVNKEQSNNRGFHKETGNKNNGNKNEVNRDWIDNNNSIQGYDREKLELQFHDQKFEIPSFYLTATSFTATDDHRKSSIDRIEKTGFRSLPQSTMSSLFQTLTSANNECMLTSLQNCAMTS